MRYIFILFILTAFSIPMAVADSDVTGFDGFPWGSKQSILDGRDHETKEKMNGRMVSAVVWPENKPRFIGAKISHKVYYFKKDYGLCAGKMVLYTGVGFSLYDRETLLEWIRAAIGDKYGAVNSKNRISQSQWATKKGIISIEPVSKKVLGKWQNYYEITYKSTEFINTQAEYDKEIAQNLKQKGALNGFNL